MTERVVLRSDHPETTREIAAVLAAHVRPGDAIALSGELGAGKTCFVQGLARALGVEGRVTSPTFVLVRTYEGRVRLVHCDVYRLDRLQDVFDLGDEVLAADALTVIEWGDAVSAILPEDHLDVVLTLDAQEVAPDTEPARHLTVQGHGSWTARLAPVVEDWRPWLASGAAGTDGGG